jgi:Concanavalin A-like lectin/glucanases superfamily
MNKLKFIFSAVVVFCFSLVFTSTAENTTSEPGNLSVPQSGQCVKPPSGLVSWWPGDGDASDITSGNSGTLQNGATFAPGMVSQAFSFDGVDDYVEVPHDASLDIGTGFTFDAWIKADNLQATQLWCIVDKSHQDPGIGWTCHGVENSYTPPGFPGNRATVPGEIFCSVGNGGVFTLVGTQTNVKDGQFHHIALAWTGTELQIYLDGVLKEINPMTGPVTNNIDPLRFGQTVMFYRPFHGLVDEAEFFNRALTASEIDAIYNAGSAGKCRKLTICHRPGTPAQNTLVIPTHALAGHLSHGDAMGPCQ